MMVNFARTLPPQVLRGDRRCPPSDLDLLLAFGIFRIAAILQRVYHRGQSGNAASDGALDRRRRRPPRPSR